MSHIENMMPINFILYPKVINHCNPIYKHQNDFFILKNQRLNKYKKWNIQGLICFYFFEKRFLFNALMFSGSLFLSPKWHKVIYNIFKMNKIRFL